MAPRTKGVEAATEYLGREEEFSIDAIGSGQKDLEVIDKVVPSESLSLEAFMHEPVCIVVHDSNDPNDVELVPVSVNGNQVFIQRNQPTTVKRCFVERLARAKRTSYTQDLDDRLGEAMNTMKPRHSLRYPFSVVEDKNPKGSAWLRGILAERT